MLGEYRIATHKRTGFMGSIIIIIIYYRDNFSRVNFIGITMIIYFFLRRSTVLLKSSRDRISAKPQNSNMWMVFAHLNMPNSFQIMRWYSV